MQHAQALAHAQTCPACTTTAVQQPLWRIDDTPQMSVRILRDAAAAHAFPRGNIALVRCMRCGFVWNAAYDPTSQHWDAGYEETQACSPRFNAFVDELGDWLQQRMPLQGRRVVEIGCGKGHFLAALCRQFGCTGLGIDPAFDPARHPAPDQAGLEFRTELFDEDTPATEADVLICRHMLEHVAQPRALLARMLARCGKPTDVFIEVPDFARIAAEGAFWDIYYEHCSYFDAASLQACCAAAGLGPVRIEPAFGAQYLLCTTTSHRGATPAELDGSPDAGLVGRRLDAAVEAWRAQFSAWSARSERAVLWGGGSKAVAFLSAVPTDESVLPAVVDINPHKHGSFLPGSAHPVIAPAQLAALQPEHVVIMNPIYREEIAARLDALGLNPQLHPVDAIAARGAAAVR